MIRFNPGHITLVSALFLHLTTCFAQYESESFETLSTGQGLSSSVVTCILKDSRGFIWFGTQSGLNRFDGYEFTTYYSNDSVINSISGNYILSLFEDRDGTLWVGTQNKGVNKYDKDKDHFINYKNDTSIANSISGFSVRCMLQLNNGDLYFGTNNGIFILDNDTKTIDKIGFPDDNELSTIAIYELYRDLDGSIWIGTTNGLFHYFPWKKKAEQYRHQADLNNSLSNDVVNSILRTSGGDLYIATNYGLNVFNESTQTFIRFYYPDPVYSEAKSEIQALVEDRRGNLWLGSFGGGLIKLDLDEQKRTVYINDPEDEFSISNDYVYSLFADDAGILWIGTYGGGVNKIDQVRIQFETLQHSKTGEGLISNDVYSILTTDLEVWIGTDKGISVWNQESDSFLNIMEQESESALSGGNIYALLEDSEKNIWIGTAENGLNKLSYENRQSGKFIFEHFKVDDDIILSLFQDSKGSIWVGTSNGISIIKNNQLIRNFRNNPGDSLSLIDNEVYCFEESDDGKIWIGTFSGISIFHPDDSIFTTPVADLDLDITNSVYSILQDNSGSIWVGTDNSGLIKIDPENEKVIRNYTRSDELPDNVIYSILEDDENNLWLSSNKGITKAIRQQSSDNLTFVNYNSSNWLTIDSYNIGSCEKGPQGNLYFGSFQGLCHFHPDDVKGNTYKPPVYITDFELFFNPVEISNDNSTPLSKHISETREIELGPKQNVIKFKFTALNYIQPDQNRYAFRMENLDEKWNYTNGVREAQYLYIPPGDYVFHVKASNNNGIWNETGTSINITIRPPFTQTIWFYIIIVVGLAVTGFWIISLRTRRLRIARDKLEKQVQSRTRELRRTNQNLQEEIQERKKVQEELARSEARFRQLIETMNEGFSVQDAEGKINYVNPKLCEMFGFDQKEIIGKFPLDFIDDSEPDNKERFLKYRQMSMEKQIVGTYEMQWRRKDGSTFIAMVSPKPIFDSENKYTGSVAVLTDITDLKNAEKELIKKNKDLNVALENLKLTQSQLIDSEKMASLGQLTAGVAHEINNPINFVSGNVLPLKRDIKDILDVLEKYDQIIEKLKMSADFNEVYELREEIDFEFVISEIDNLLDGIGEGASRTAEIVKGLRNFSRMDEHELKLTNIHEGIDSTLLILHNKLKQRINITKEYGEFPDIMCYPGQLNQVFLNILNNAQEAIENEGEIIIKTWTENKKVHISIKDNGKGMNEKVKKKIFEPFYTTKEVGKGTGLGLSISFGIIEKHKGSIQVQSKAGKGTEFIVSIPANLS